MASISKYWEFVKLDSTSKRRVEMIVAAQTYLKKQFPELTEKVEVSDARVQRQLWQQIQSGKETDTHERQLAEICLRCYISGQIYQVCLNLATKFGNQNGFNCQDLLPFVLDDEILLATRNQPEKLASKSTQRSSYQSLATNVLKTFDPAKGSLNTWVSRYVKQHPELKRYLLQHGVFLVSDWALLNDTKPKELERILTDMYRLTSVEIQQLYELLVSYHTVYREDRLQQRLTGGTLPCQQPTSEQLIRIAKALQTSTGHKLSTEGILSQLHAIASKLRRYKITAQGGNVSSISFDQPEIQPIVERSRSVFDGESQATEDDEEQLEFVKLYQNQFIECLDQTLAQVIDEYITKLQRKRSSVEQSFLTALHLFHCQGQSMNQIAPQINLTKQYEVTRLLKLNELRADIRQRLLVKLRDRVLDTAKFFVDSERLLFLDRQLELILDEQISGIIQEAESEAKNPIRNQPLRSLLARRLCRYLESRRQENN
ncbi:hypothetical protein H6G81_04425 [Scytonema hofmannii FACHB-248]|uniref:Uncharacterized protein n=1 Tax=Scytonema hofmannii FACHB-248 TaxID=1842502 RepID=A0ABR8GK75_9CYAN|nr:MULTISPECIES: hypothetical protein [Nostocales]MBD2603795.1 hypothetical protein [Scytonema hofmannii FACHB-248]